MCKIQLLPLLLALCTVSLALGQPAGNAPEPSRPSVRGDTFGQTPDGRTVNVYTLRNSHGLQARVINYGAMLISLRTPDRQGCFEDVVLGFDTLEEYLHRNFGGTTGRYANRIGGARFTLDGIEYRLTANAGVHHIHGGRRNFSNVLWEAEGFADADRAGVRLTYLSRDGEEGFPGNLKCTVTYALNNDNELKIEYAAQTDKPTVVNLTNHGYYNLAGSGGGDVRNHVLQIDAEHYTLADEALIPTGEIAAVQGTPLDFRTPRPIGERLDELVQTRGYDHNYVFDDWYGGLALRVHVWEPGSGRFMEVLTTEPGMQLYTANHLRDLKGRDGKIYPQHGAFCLETQHFPDSPNKSNFPSTILRPDERFYSATVHRFSVRQEDPFGSRSSPVRSEDRL